VLQVWNARDEDELIALVHATPGPNVPALARVVLACAEEGDALSQKILREAGKALGAVVCRLLRREGVTNPRVAMTGSILENVTPVREAMVETLLHSFADARVQQGMVDPLEGALLRARKAKTAVNGV